MVTNHTIHYVLHSAQLWQRNAVPCWQYIGTEDCTWNVQIKHSYFIERISVGSVVCTMQGSWFSFLPTKAWPWNGSGYNVSGTQLGLSVSSQKWMIHCLCGAWEQGGSEGATVGISRGRQGARD